MIRLLNLFAFTSLIASSVSVAAPNLDLDTYAKAGERVDIGQSRRLNLRCSGKGEPAVILESGAVADSFDWFKVQPLISPFARVCSYDRAGYGFSDGGASKDYIAGSADDLHRLIRVAHIPTPVVLVGHSLGTDIVRNFAMHFPNEVAALVLLDPPPQGIQDATATQRQERDEANAGRAAMLEACKKGATKLQSDPPPAELKSCLRPPNPDYSAKLNAARRTSKTKPAFWDSTAYALDAGSALDFQPVAATEKHGDLPLLILQPDAPFDGMPPEERTMLEAARQRTQNLIAATSRRAEIVPVMHSSHDVQFDRPDAVVDAVRKAIGELSGSSAPADLAKPKK
ncbi:MAG: alpha/beta hydrolase [Rudaea sp.]